MRDCRAESKLWSNTSWRRNTEDEDDADDGTMMTTQVRSTDLQEALSVGRSLCLFVGESQQS